jgi:queuine tRNA-ribosyltransferase
MADSKRPVSFEIEAVGKGNLARAGIIHTPHGDIHTPAFVVVGTKASVKSLMPEDLTQYVGNEVTLANTYTSFSSLVTR